MFIAGTLSRIVSRGDCEFDNWENKEVKITINGVNKYSEIRENKREKFKIATEVDKESKVLKTCEVEGWPKQIENLP